MSPGNSDMSDALTSLKIQPYRQRVYNWSHTFSCTPELIFEPTGIEEVQLIVNEARKLGKQIRPVGEHSSPGQVFCTDEVRLKFSSSELHVNATDPATHLQWMLRMHRIAHHKITVGTRQATLGAGMLVRTANKVLYEAGLSFPIVGSIDEVSVGAIFADSVHNSSTKHASLADRVVECTVVLANGSVRKLCRDSEDDDEKQLFAATGCGCGATGVIYDVTYDLEPAFGLAPRFEKICLREVLAKGTGEGGLLEVAKHAEFVKVRFKRPQRKIWLRIMTDLVFPEYNA